MTDTSTSVTATLTTVKGKCVLGSSGNDIDASEIHWNLLRYLCAQDPQQFFMLTLSTSDGVEISRVENTPSGLRSYWFTEYEETQYLCSECGEFMTFDHLDGVWYHDIPSSNCGSGNVANLFIEPPAIEFIGESL